MKNKEVSKNFYVVITASILYNKSLSHRQKLLVALVSNLSNEKGYCWASNDHFTEAMCCESRTVQRDFEELEDLGFIKRKIFKNEDGSVNHRRIYLTNLAVSNLTVGGDEGDVRGGDEDDTIITNNLKTNNNTSKSATIVAKIAAVKLRDLFNAEHGTQTRIVSEKTVRQLKALIEAGYTVENVIEASKELKKEKWLAERNFKELNIEFITRPDKMEKYYNQVTASIPKQNMGANEYLDNFLKGLNK